MPVALRKESVDRNRKPDGNGGWGVASLSARRAWIEIDKADFTLWDERVALRKESVDRNCKAKALAKLRMTSLSARRAWIEMYLTILKIYATLVALRKESVDRNIGQLSQLAAYKRRSPQGERG